MTSNPLPNPYIAGDPVQGHNRFIGRTDVLHDVLRMLHNPNANAIVLYGQRRIGKTSILLQLQRQLASRRDYIPIYFDLQDKAVLPLAEVLYQLAQRIAASIRLENTPRNLFDSAGNFFRRAFLPQAAKQVGQRSLILLFDEFDVLDSPQKEQASESFFPYLRSWMEDSIGVKFVFVLGRRPEDLSTNTLATFKQVTQRQVSLMSREDSLAIVRQSEQNGSLYWGDTGAERIWYWTQGHPYLTQLLCSEIWEAIHDEHSDKPIIINAYDVDRAVPETLKLGAHALLWIWNGLPPAERIVMAAMAEVNKTVVNQDELTKILTNSGVRLILRELELAPETLIQWDLLRPTEGGYSFAIPILKQWVAINNPLLRVKRDLDSIDPLAESLYQSADGYYRLGNLQEAEVQLRSALDLNPNHMRSRLLLGNILLKNGNPLEAVTELEFVYKYDSLLAHQYLIEALLALAKNTPDEDRRLIIHDRVLVLEPKHSIAWPEKKIIWRKRAQLALNQLDFETAEQAYQKINDGEGIEYVQAMRHKTEKNKLIKDALNYEREEAWNEVILIYEKLLSDFPDEQYLQQKLENAQLQENMAQTYNKALVMLQKGDTRQASKLLINIMSQTPTYRDAIYYLVLAVRGVDIFALQQSNNELKIQLTNQATRFQQLLESERTAYQQEVLKLKSQVDLNIQEKDAGTQKITSLKNQLISDAIITQSKEKAYEQTIADLKGRVAYLLRLANSQPRASMENEINWLKELVYSKQRQESWQQAEIYYLQQQIKKVNQRLEEVLKSRILILLASFIYFLKHFLKSHNTSVANTIIWLPLTVATLHSFLEMGLHENAFIFGLFILIVAWLWTGALGSFSDERTIYGNKVVAICLAVGMSNILIDRLPIHLIYPPESAIYEYLCGYGIVVSIITGTVTGFWGRTAVKIIGGMNNVVSGIATSVTGGIGLSVTVKLLGGEGAEVGIVIFYSILFLLKTSAIKWISQLQVSLLASIGLAWIIYWLTEKLIAFNQSSTIVSTVLGIVSVSLTIWIAKPRKEVAVSIEDSW